jgi:hypothetical protein
MNNLNKTLLSGVALYALTSVPAVADGFGQFHITLLHGGRVLNKTKMHTSGATRVTSTFSAFSYIAFSDYFGHKKPLRGSFFKYNNSGDICSNPPQTVKVEPKKTLYGKASTYTTTYSENCAAPVTFYGAAYKITDPNAKGNTDFVHVIDKATFYNDGKKYKGTLNMDINVTIE